MKMRFAWYAGASTGLAATVIVSAFHQRANFYSAMVHLSQSSLSLMVLVNLVFVVYGSFMYGLQRLFYGPLRPVEIEQLYERAWFAVTETCLAMTIFREEIGAFFLVMFTSLVTGKVWGWIGEGRVEVLEQQPPANPRLFHARLSLSLVLSLVYDTAMLMYAFNTVVQQARPTMMLMFLFEFAVLAVNSFQTSTRYIISLAEQRIIRTQTRNRLEERRRQVREQRAAFLQRREAGEAAEGEEEELPNEEDVDEMDIEVPGWESKGQWILTLDLVIDVIKFCIYTAFFCILFTFFGLPIHIIRDWFMTTRSCLKRLNALIRYRQALKDMDQYPDATAEDLERENTCIICREEMNIWDASDATQVERTRAKKLPCGHILHFGCLKSWLERQQVCPTCRRPVSNEGNQQPANGDAMVFRLGLNFPGGQNRQPQPEPQPNGQPQGGQAPPPDNGQANNNRGVRMFHFGPLRLGIAQGAVNEIPELAQRLREDAGQEPAATAPATPQQPPNDPSVALEQIRAQLVDVAQRIQQDMATLADNAHEHRMLSLMLGDLDRLREGRQQPQGQQQGAMPANAPVLPPGQLPLPGPMVPNFMPADYTLFPPPPPPSFSRHTATGYGTAIPSGSPDLPEGLSIPPGWSLLPLERLEGGATPTNAAVPPPGVPQGLFPRTTRASNEGGPSSSSQGPLGGDNQTTPGNAPLPLSPQSSSVSGDQGRVAPADTEPTPLPDWSSSWAYHNLDTATAPLSQDEPGESSRGPIASRPPPADTSATVESGPTGSSSNKGKGKAASAEEAGSDSDE
ncbi:ERAD-associated E3 ubiquitin-protein ligase HRD1 [Podospora conica]|nr:ERAD-associated E3 ubiquitin-protein ligase HRD1 [Schizothecium conicum]